MAKRKSPLAGAGGQVPGEPSPEPLTWREEKFAETYVRNGGNSMAAYRSAFPKASYETSHAEARRFLAKPRVKMAIEQARAEWQQAAKITREDILVGLLGIVAGTSDDYTDAMQDPLNKEAYAGLGVKKHGLQIKTSTENGTELIAASVGERRAAFNDLWEKLGYGEKGSGKPNTKSPVDGLLELGEALGRLRQA